ncbi:CYTH domain-containing protein [Flavobacteriaceae bacterium S0825]|uniref:CYTH domain-containing protein n=1 Tax=Gaetbulibacter sp. S0825 TaxID=2720084 RepID=UPI001430E30A|nr:CYTH domain-containing protein [Gaetbulibacter sp. S0825]MCK0108163.1 CYTH domain-containing protein [Flavobacteriaceae bacterium S0825]NIX63799.1 CYTH domain-containing protein [Gaetbulibacter sp. S0825]
MIEIERKFLVTSDAFKEESHQKFRIIQGFLNRDPERTVRIRLKDNKGMLTVKGLSSNDGLSRFEWEKDISKKDAKALLEFCVEGVIDKLRFEVKVNNHIFEVDEFYGDNEGLVIAEVELETEEETFTKPEWLGEEVTGNIRYYNSQLSKQPFNTWE